jgi:hypothetical protein
MGKPIHKTKGRPHFWSREMEFTASRMQSLLIVGTRDVTVVYQKASVLGRKK